MDPSLITETPFSEANSYPYTLAEIWPFSMVNGESDVYDGLGLQMGTLDSGFIECDGSLEESTVTEGSCGGNGRKKRDFSLEIDSSKIVSAICSNNDVNYSNHKRSKIVSRKDGFDSTKGNMGISSGPGQTLAKQYSKPREPHKQDYIHVRARRGQATDSHSLAERARREKISERMRILQELVPGCNKIVGKALVLDEIINYIQSLQRQVEFLSMKLEAINSRVNPNSNIDDLHLKDFVLQSYDATSILFGSPTIRECGHGAEPGWPHMQAGANFQRAV